ncbi:MAG TPA: hypothetical protein VIF09_14705 [Polyangiaceae bacterium]
MRSRFLFVSSVLLLLGPANACANGGNGSAGATDDEGGLPGDGGPTGDGTVKGDAKGDAPGGDGGGSVSAAKACADNATSYCTQLQTCADNLYKEQYNDTLTCTTAQTAGCLDALAAPNTGWTGAKLEACVAARTALSCNDFLFGKPQPKACQITGNVFNGACRYSGQCGSGYCRFASGAACGTCVSLGETGSPCTTASDCDGNLMCATAGTCQPPVSVGSPCGPANPCQSGLACISGNCAAPGQVGASCAAANNGADCDSTQGLYCDTTTSQCKQVLTPNVGGTCGGSIPTVCVGSGTCSAGTCVAPVADKGACNPKQGQNCMAPDSCNDAGTCALITGADCAGDGG